MNDKHQTKPDAIDYSAISDYRFQKVLPLAIRQTFRSKRYKKVNLLLTTVVVLMVLLALVDPSDRRAGILSALDVLVYYLIPFGIWTAYYLYKLRTDQLEAFAAANGWQFRSPKKDEPLPRALAPTGDAGYTTRILEMIVDGVRWDLFSMTSGSKSPEFSVFCTKLPRSLPAMILDSHQTKGMLLVPKGWVRIELEGTFPKNFTLHIPKNTQIGVLSYLAPDLMNIIDQNHRLNDIEVRDDYLYVLADGHAWNVASLQKTLPTLQQLYRKLQ
jgi:hypothetical protein